MLKLLCSGGKDGSEQMESETCENNRSQEVISSVLADLSDCLTSEATCSLVSYLSLLVIQDGKSAFTFSQILFFCPHGLNIAMVFHLSPINKRRCMIFPENFFHLETFFRFSITCLFHFTLAEQLYFSGD